ncbi:hypothetical protein PCH_Pc16g04200 [Penicillium rubens Wisconsin 54-1255]|uniref:Uncharacterized protein n=1 Tax=Penicillium rubens (strain ATCC 28089 / DSM 1075 / NRRL 1951 / Wisconsin 54-1255) TaxID=500485 RepID=B6H8F2_PENRW|nr:hypothetical protein PCH_Pc16g04200 [Penicillium rubens Wisconsin 54-1255]
MEFGGAGGKIGDETILRRSVPILGTGYMRLMYYEYRDCGYLYSNRVGPEHNSDPVQTPLVNPFHHGLFPRTGVTGDRCSGSGDRAQPGMIIQLYDSRIVMMMGNDDVYSIYKEPLAAKIQDIWATNLERGVERSPNACLLIGTRRDPNSDLVDTWIVEPGENKATMNRCSGTSALAAR